MFEWLTRLSIADQVYVSILLLTTAIVGVQYRHLSVNLRPLLWLSATNLFVELITGYIHFVLHQNNMYIYHLLTVAEFIFISTLFYYTFIDSKLRQIVLWSVPIFLLLVMLYSLHWEPPTENNPYSFITESILIIVWCYLFFRETLSRKQTYMPEKDRTFWIVIGILFYFTGKFFILGGINYFDKLDPTLARRIYQVGYAFNYLLYFTISLVCLIRFPNTAYD